ncbi:(2Fe-2S) ferredoxin domain-containing protein [Anaerobacillus sp. MEB173]|uniref:(2Fe-2S) ferredoxin domain-containing protein n=1 Tax=Anaerobacillus sp. MEB173 TaxID=3383345 RepID=UPI003F931360
MATWNLSTTKHHILICNGSSCKKAGAEELTQSVRNEIMAKRLDSVIHTSRTLCNGRCHDKCVLITYPDGHWYKEMTGRDAPQLVESLLKGSSIEDKVSHYYNGECFIPNEGTVLGVYKDEGMVKKVSKKF